MIADDTVEIARQRAQTHLFDQKEPSATLQYSVIVPVRNEAHHLTQTLEALRLQSTPDGQILDPLTYEVLVLVNNCTDASLAIAQSYQRRYPAFALQIAYVQLPPDQANIGTVRRLLMDEAYRRLTLVGSSAGIIASTDGDTVVDPQWLWYIKAEMEQGADAIGGRILTHPDKNPVRRFHLRDVTYRTLVAQLEAHLDPRPHDPWPRHFQHFGANMAVTCSAYEQAGRLPEVPYLEDEAFFQALTRIDARVRQSPLVRVITSARTQGRVAIGFSEQLRCWATMQKNGQCQLAEPAEAIMTRLLARHQLRLCWANYRNEQLTVAFDTIAQRLGISADWLRDTMPLYRYFGAYWQAIEQRMSQEQIWAQRWPPVPITATISKLRSMVWSPRPQASEAAVAGFTFSNKSSR